MKFKMTSSHGIIYHYGTVCEAPGRWLAFKQHSGGTWYICLHSGKPEWCDNCGPITYPTKKEAVAALMPYIAAQREWNK